MDPNSFTTLQQQGLDKKDPVFGLNDVGGSSLDFVNSSYNPVNAAWEAYSNFRKSQPLPLDLYNQQELQLNIPQKRAVAQTLSQQISDTQDILDRAESDVDARSNSSIVTEAQRRGMTEAYKSPFLQRLGGLSRDYDKITGGIREDLSDANTRVGYQLQGQELQADPFKLRINLQAEQQARQITGFSSDREMRFNILMDKINRGRTLSDQERAEAFELAKLDKTYQLEKEKAGWTPDNSLISVGENSRLYNPATGQWITPPGGGGGGGSTGITFGGGGSTTSGGWH